MFSRKLTGAAAIAVTLALTGGTVAAQQQQDGLVNVMIGDITVEDVNVAAAVTLVVQACELVGPVAIGVLARAIAVDRSGRSQTICRAEAGDVTITQN